MNLDDLQSVRSKERQKDSLQHLRSTFYADAAEFIQSLRDEREAAAARADDPFDAPEVRRLSDDIKTAESTVEAVYERRIGKLVKLASLDAAGMPVDDDGLTAEEEGVYETLVTAIEENRAHVLSVLSGEGVPTSTDEETEAAEPAPESTESPTSGVSAADMMGSAGATEPADESRPVPPEPTADEHAPEVPPDEPEYPDADPQPGADSPEPTADAEPEAADEAEKAEEADDERTTVRITKDVGEIFGIDQRTYVLSAEDVVTLPSANAKPLVDQDAAEPLN
ncbi:hypothetical protein [Haladaptatus sp. ZSTT2]|uniref:hypothetical protein n=1 Tax=Haladaptatus sp. ZSTT2 TaxID=3120515 RepID=UPI00300E937B